MVKKILIIIISVYFYSFSKENGEIKVIMVSEQGGENLGNRREVLTIKKIDKKLWAFYLPIEHLWKDGKPPGWKKQLGESEIKQLDSIIAQGEVFNNKSCVFSSFPSTLMIDVRNYRDIKSESYVFDAYCFGNKGRRLGVNVRTSKKPISYGSFVSGMFKKEIDEAQKWYRNNEIEKKSLQRKIFGIWRVEMNGPNVLGDASEVKDVAGKIIRLTKSTNCKKNESCWDRVNKCKDTELCWDIGVNKIKTINGPITPLGNSKITVKKDGDQVNLFFSLPKVHRNKRMSFTYHVDTLKTNLIVLSYISGGREYKKMRKDEFDHRKKLTEEIQLRNLHEGIQGCWGFDHVLDSTYKSKDENYTKDSLVFFLKKIKFDSTKAMWIITKEHISLRNHIKFSLNKEFYKCEVLGNHILLDIGDARLTEKTDRLNIEITPVDSDIIKLEITQGAWTLQRFLPQ